MPAPMGVGQRPMIPLSDDFKAPVLKATWGAWNEADMGRFQTGHGVLWIRAKGDSSGRSSPLTVMARDASYQIQVTAGDTGRLRRSAGPVLQPRKLAVCRVQERTTARLWPQADAGEPCVESSHGPLEDRQPAQPRRAFGQREWAGLAEPGRRRGHVGLQQQHSARVPGAAPGAGGQWRGPGPLRRFPLPCFVRMPAASAGKNEYSRWDLGSLAEIGIVPGI